MRRALRILAWIVGALIALPIVAVALVLILLNTGFGRAQVEARLPALTGDMVRLSGLSGRFPDALRLAHVEVRDAQGAWVTVDDIALDWSPLRLISGEASIQRLSAARVAVPRLPAPSAAQPAPASSSGGFSLPVSVRVDDLDVARAEIGAPVAGVAAVLALKGDARAASLDDARANLSVRRLDGPGDYAVDAALTPTRIDAHVTLAEPAGGLIGGVAGLTTIGAIAADATVAGPKDALATRLALHAGPLTAAADGSVDLTHGAADLHVQANAPAMQPAPGVSWQSVALDARVRGPFTAPDAAGTLRVADLAAGGAGVGAIAADIAGNAGHVALDATAERVTIPGPKPDLFAASPLCVQATAELKQPGRSIVAHVTHALLDLTANATLDAATVAKATLRIPDLAPFAQAGGIDLQGGTTLDLGARVGDGATDATLSGKIGVTGGMAPVPALLGPDATIDAAARVRGSDITLDRLTLGGKTLSVDAKGRLAAGKLDAAYTLALADLAAVAPNLSGTLAVKGTANGPQDNLAVAAHADAEVATKGVKSGPLALDVNATGLPAAPAGTVAAHGELDGAPVDARLAATRAADGAAHLSIDRLTWRSLSADGTFDLAVGATLPVGKLALIFGRLEDARALSGMPLAGRVEAHVDATRDAVKLNLAARDAGLSGTASVASAKLIASVADPLGRRAVDATLTADGIAASGITGRAKVTAKGPQDALAIAADTSLANVAGGDASLTTALVANVTAMDAAVSRLEATVKGQTVRLLAPVRVSFGGAVGVDRLRLGLQQAVLDVAGRVSPTLDLTAKLTGVTPDLASAFAPALKADGTLTADARLTGTTARPAGTVRIEARGLHPREGNARALPPANLVATATLAGTSARIDVKGDAGPRLDLTGSGTVPIGAGPIDVRARARLDLAVLDPILTANGERARGTMTLDGGVAGTASAPRATGSVTLANGEVQDFAQGVHLTDVAARLDALGDTIRLTSLTAKAGPGTIAAQGTVGVAGDMPIDMTLAMRNARPLASDKLTADIDADLTLRGALATKMAAGGSVRITRAEVRIPEHLPASVVSLRVRNAGTPPPAPVPPGSVTEIDLAIALHAERIFVRGRGLDVELGGDMKLGGTAANPQPQGGFSMRRGELSLAGQTLTFTKGDVSFNGGAITDPSLDFVASTTNGSTTANLNVGGTASNPKITLSSTPDLPQDEILAQILFHRSASDLSPIELAQAAAALASFTGATGGADPLDAIRQGLGLDRLSVGSGAGGSPAVTAGRYVAPGVFVGAKQTAGGGTQATVQVDLYKGLKLEGTAGTGGGTAQGSSTSGQTQSNGSGVGLTYQFEY